MAKKDDPWADKPDRFDQADRAWEDRWSDRQDDDEGDDWDQAVSPDYRGRRATPGSVSDAYGDGMRAAGSHLGFGLQIGMSMAFFVGLGIVVDRWLDTSPWGVIVGAVLGMIGIVVLVLRVAKEPNG